MYYTEVHPRPDHPKGCLDYANAGSRICFVDSTMDFGGMITAKPNMSKSVAASQHKHRAGMCVVDTAISTIHSLVLKACASSQSFACAQAMRFSPDVC
jgi:hypothetical protein